MRLRRSATGGEREAPLKTVSIRGLTFGGCERTVGPTPPHLQLLKEQLARVRQLEGGHRAPVDALRAQVLPRAVVVVPQQPTLRVSSHSIR